MQGLPSDGAKAAGCEVSLPGRLWFCENLLGWGEEGARAAVGAHSAELQARPPARPRSFLPSLPRTERYSLAAS